MQTSIRFSPETETILAGEGAEAERLGTLTAAQLKVIREAGWFRMFVPRESGGLQLPLPEALAVEEALASIDGSLGWTVTLCSGAGLFAGFVEPALRNLMFNDPELCIGGSGMPSGTAERIPGGYQVTGDWRYATGAPHLSAFSANCRITADGEPLSAPDGTPEMRSFLFLPAEVEVYDDWKVMGLRATASQSFRITGLEVPGHRSFLIRPEAATSPDPVYQYPFIQFAELTLAANFGGMGIGFVDAFRDGLDSHGGPSQRRTIREAALNEAADALEPVLRSFHEVAERSWDRVLSDGVVPADMLDAISRCSRELSATARRIVGALAPYAGLSAANPATRMNRIWRDMFTATQHSLLTYPA